MRVIAFAGCMGLSVLVTVPVGAQVADMPLTPRELQYALAGASSGGMWPRIYPSRTTPAVIASPSPANYHARYLSASLGDRVTIAQLIGEEGVERYAAGRQLKTLLSPLGRNTPIGPDSVFWNRSSGKVQVLEAKGGSSVPKWTYRSLQGTNVNAIRSAGGVLTHPGASWREKLQAARVIKAAQSGHLETGVIRTPHVLGVPRAPRQSAGMDVENVAGEARHLEHRLVRRNPKLRAAFRTAGVQHETARLAYRSAKWIPATKLKQGWVPFSPHAISRWHLAANGLAESRARQVGRLASRSLFPIAMGVAGVTVTVAISQLANASISSREFLHVSAGPAIVMVFTGAGALIGGLTSSGMGVLPGAAAGGILALPFQLGLEWVMDRYYRDFNWAQRNAVDEAIQVMYLETG